MASSTQELNDLHRLVTQSLTQRITLDMEDNIPTDAATLGAAIKLLKDNNITADPADKDDLSNLRDKLSQAANNRKRGIQNSIGLADADIKVMVG